MVTHSPQIPEGPALQPLDINTYNSPSRTPGRRDGGSESPVGRSWVEAVVHEATIENKKEESCVLMSHKRVNDSRDGTNNLSKAGPSALSLETYLLSFYICCLFIHLGYVSCVICLCIIHR